MFGLETDFTLLLLFCLLCACAFEFINGFHDTANAVATVIYTNSLKPMQAVVWSAIWNSIGVFTGGISVAMGIVNLLPPEILVNSDIGQNVAMVLSLLFSAIIWNFLTWYKGIPASSSHTLIGAILGVGIAFSFFQGDMTMKGVNWSKAGDIGLSLLFSPLIGFGATVLVMWLLQAVVKNPLMFQAPKGDAPPPTWVRLTMIFACTGVSFSHGSNDGQKGVGLMMLILIGIVPMHFAINTEMDTFQLEPHVSKISEMVIRLDENKLSKQESEKLLKIKAELFDLKQIFDKHRTEKAIPPNEYFNLRTDIIFVASNLNKLYKEGTLQRAGLNPIEIQYTISQIKEMKKFTEYAPIWVIGLISLSLGLGTMIGWKRIVVTIGEKIGKQQLNYAQGASSQLVAATTIGIASITGLPVSTTQVLSSGIAGSMVATRGLKNLQGGTLKTIALAWLLTFPVTVILSAVLYSIFRLIF